MPAADAEMPQRGEDWDTEISGVSPTTRIIKSLAARLSFTFYRWHFELVRADSEELCDLVYRLRYQVYAHEYGFENPEDFPDDRESDKYDARSQHILLRHHKSGILVGTARLVLPDPADRIRASGHGNRINRPDT